MSPAADRFPAVFFPMVLAVLVRDGGSRALYKARSVGVARKEKEQASGGRRCGGKVYCGEAAVFMGLDGKFQPLLRITRDPERTRGKRMPTSLPPRSPLHA